MNLFDNFLKYKKNIALIDENNRKIDYQSLSSLIEKLTTHIKRDV